MNKVAPAPSDLRAPKVAWSHESGEGGQAVERPPTDAVLPLQESLPSAKPNSTLSSTHDFPAPQLASGASSSTVILTSHPLRAHELDAVPDITAAVSSERMVRNGLRCNTFRVAACIQMFAWGFRLFFSRRGGGPGGGGEFYI